MGFFSCGGGIFVFQQRGVILFQPWWDFFSVKGWNVEGGIFFRD